MTYELLERIETKQRYIKELCYAYEHSSSHFFQMCLFVSITKEKSKLKRLIRKYNNGKEVL